MSTPTHRRDDKEKGKKNCYRMSRFFLVHGEWFFSYREGGQVGPFESKALAEQGAKRYVEFIQRFGNNSKAVQAAKNGLDEAAMKEFKC